jgi:hypothetical protein
VDSSDFDARLDLLRALDNRYGAEAKLPLEDVDGLVAAILTDPRMRAEPETAIDVAAWAIRHGVDIAAPEPVVNALALQANATRAKDALAAIARAMQRLAAHLEPRLAPDLERSNPERPWRILHINLAITAIRTEDAALIGEAFDALDRALPDESAGFYGEALALALSPRIDPAVRRLIEERHARRR